MLGGISALVRAVFGNPWRCLICLSFCLCTQLPKVFDDGKRRGRFEALRCLEWIARKELAGNTSKRKCEAAPFCDTELRELLKAIALETDRCLQWNFECRDPARCGLLSYHRLLDTYSWIGHLENKHVPGANWWEVF